MSGFTEIMQLLPLISEDSRPSWSKAVRDLCFKPFGMNDTLNHSLNQGKNKWATTKDLQITVAMPTEKVYISGKGAGKFRNDGRRVITGELVKGSATLTPNKSQTFPGFISADASDSELIFTGTDNEFETKYVNDKDNVLKSDSIPNVLANRLSVIDSVSISSSAPGLLASTDFLLKTIKNNLEINPDIFPGGDPEDKEAARQGLYHWISQVLGRYFGNLAIPVSLADSKAKMLDNASTDIVDIKSQVGTRLIDGGYVDNTAVTSALHSIQAKNNLQDKDQDQKDFSITILSNVTGGIGSISTDDGKDIQITMDVKDLFGASNSAALKKKGGGMDFLQADIHTVSPHVFNRDALKIDNEWSYVDKDNDTYLRYYTIDVETVDNKAFGIKEGSKGVLNVFMNVTTKSDAAPFEKRIFNLYENLYKTTSNQLSKSDIHDHILGSLGIPTLIQGSRKSEKLKGTKFSERINANAGDDVIVATRGSDVLVGGRGLDLFKYDRIADSPNKKNHKDTILRFNPLEGDRIDLTEIAEIDFIGRENFSGPNQANWDGGTLMINLDEDSKAEMSISIKTPANLFEIDDIFV